MQKSEIETTFDKMCGNYPSCELCKKCRELRKEFSEEDRTQGNGKKKQTFDRFSNFFIGFSNKNLRDLRKPIDVLFVLESHGGGPENFKKEREFESAEASAENLKKYYVDVDDDDVKGLHQYEFQRILKLFHESFPEQTYFATDLVKCYVKKAHKNKIYNIAEAAMQCKKNYLDKQIKVLRPKLIVGFGWLVKNSFGCDDANQGFIDERVTINGEKINFLGYYFPGGGKAHLWMRQRDSEEENPIKKIKEKLRG